MLCVAAVLWAFTLPERKEVVCRIGWLCLWNPLLPDGMYHLDMSVWEDHKLAELLVKLAVVEPGENWEDETYNPTCVALRAAAAVPAVRALPGFRSRKLTPWTLMCMSAGTVARRAARSTAGSFRCRG